MLIDFHIHSTHTQDSPNTIADIVSKLANCGLNGFCLTDVHTMAGLDDAKKTASEAGLVALVGMETLTDKGHFLVFVPHPEELPDIPEWVEINADGIIPIQALLDAVKSRKGILIAAHPYDRSVKHSCADGIIQLGGLSAIEVNNARRSYMVNHMAEEVAAGMGLVGVAGSDARADLAKIGSVATLVRGSVETESDLIEKVLSHDVWPVLIGEQPQRRSAPRRRQSYSKNKGSRGGRSSDRSHSGGRSRDRQGRKPRERNQRGGSRSKS